MRRILRIGYYIIVPLVLVTLAGTVGYLTAMTSSMNILPADQRLPLPKVAPPAYHPGQPIVAVLLAQDLTEATDFLTPYDLFASAGQFNVYAVAPKREVTTLMGGIDVVPHYALADFDARFPQGPDVVVVPAMPTIDDAANQPILTWLRQHANTHTIIFSWCTGAEVLAKAGVLAGQNATTHWADIDGFASSYPAVHWQRGVRYVDDGSIVTSAGLTSGVDATLHVMARFTGPAVIAQLAQAWHYPTTTYVDDPHAPQYHLALPDSIYGLNAAFHWHRTSMGVLAYDGVDEAALAAIADAFPGSFTTDIAVVAPTRQAVTTRHGLTIVPRWGYAQAPTLTRLFVPSDASDPATASAVRAWQGRSAIPIMYLWHAGSSPYVFAAAVEDLAQQQNVPTAIFAAKRLEYRGALALQGDGWPIWLILMPLLIAALGVLAVWGTERGVAVVQIRRHARVDG